MTALLEPYLDRVEYFFARRHIQIRRTTGALAGFRYDEVARWQQWPNDDGTATVRLHFSHGVVAHAADVSAWWDFKLSASDAETLIATIMDRPLTKEST